MDLFVFTFQHDQLIYRALSPLSPEQVGQHGLPTQAVMGEINAALPSMTPDQFEPNQPFVELVQQIIRDHAVLVPAYLAEATNLGRGELLIIDDRTKKVTSSISEEDILGRFDISQGEINPNAYRPNENYRVLSDKGPIRLDPILEDKLLTHLQNLIQVNSKEGTDA